MASKNKKEQDTVEKTVKKRKRGRPRGSTKSKGLEDPETFLMLQELMKNPVRSLRSLAAAVGVGKQKCWRKKKELEDSHAIWGYSAVVDFEKLGWKTFAIISNIKPLSKDVAEMLIERASGKLAKNEDIIVLDSYFTAGSYDGITIFAARDTVAAKKYYDTLRLLYEDFYISKPIMLEIMFTTMRNGKFNPEIERIKELVPEVP